MGLFASACTTLPSSEEIEVHLFNMGVPQDREDGQTRSIEDEHGAVHRAQGQACPISAVAGSSHRLSHFHLGLPQGQQLLL